MLKIKNIGDALMAAGEEIKERDLVTSLINGVGHEFDPIVAVITTQRFISLEDAQFMLMMHGQRIEHLNSSSQLDVGQASDNFVSTIFKTKDVNEKGIIKAIEEVIVVEEETIALVVDQPTESIVKCAINQALIP